jgi:hypothetical protein
MQQSNDPKRKAFVMATCYLDDSINESSDPSPATLIGGLLLDRASFIRLDSRWRKMLREHRIESMHMTDFVRPHGKHVGKPREMKIALFRDATEIINSVKDYSISVSVLRSEYDQVFHSSGGKMLGPYTIAFTMASQLNVRIATTHSYPDRIAYVIDQGNRFTHQLMLGHLFAMIREKADRGLRLTGSLTFESDDNNPALQASDMIAWASRRRLYGKGLCNEFEPLLHFFKERFSADGLQIRPHIHRKVAQELMQKMEDEISSNIDGLGHEIRNLIMKAASIEG